jgi:hypothetical protein
MEHAKKNKLSPAFHEYRTGARAILKLRNLFFKSLLAMPVVTQQRD